MANDENTSMTYMDHLRAVALAGVALIVKKTKTYGPSWKKRGGAGAWFTTVRPWDRLESIVGQHGGDVFAAVSADPSGKDGSALACLRDIRNYTILIEAEMVGRDIITIPMSNESILAGDAEPHASFAHLTSEDILTLIKAGERCRDIPGASSPYGGQSIAHMLFSYGWVKRDIQLALISVHPEYALSQGAGPTAAYVDQDHGRLPGDVETCVAGLGAGAVAEGCYTTLDLGVSSELWHVGLSALPSNRVLEKTVNRATIRSLGDVANQLRNGGCLVASRQLDQGDSQIIIRIPGPQ